MRRCTSVVLALFFLSVFVLPAFPALPGFIKMQDGYFVDSVTGQPWVPHGIAYQTWNRPLGVWQTQDQINYDLDEMKKMGANSIRVDFVWQHIEELGDNIWSWTNYDFLVSACEQRDMRIFALVGYQWPPNWFPDSYYTMHPPGLDNEGIMHTNRWQSDIINYELPAARAQYSNFLYTVCNRYRNSKAVAGWIVGNEYGYLGLWSLKYDGYDTNSESAFRTWCTQKYTQITNLNAKWGSGYTNFNQIVLSDTYEWKGPKGALWADMVQWHEDSIANFTAAGARGARAGNTNHLLSYSTVGMQWGEEDWRYHAEDRGKIARACASNNAALAFFSVNNYPWAMDGSETRNGQWGISFTKKTAGIPVVYSETGFTSSETLFPGMTLDRQGVLIRNALWECLEAGGIGTHVFSWQDRPWITDREKGFGILYGDRAIKPAFWTTRDTFNLMEQVKIADVLKGSADPKPDIAFFWDEATDSQYIRFENEMQHEAGALERLGFEPNFLMGVAELANGAYTNYKAIILPRNMRVSDTVPGYTNSVLNFFLTQVLPKGIHVIAVADLPGMQDKWGKPRAAFSNEVSQLFGIDASDVGANQPAGLMEDSIYWNYYHKINIQYNTNAPAGLANYAYGPSVWKYNDRVRVNGNGGTLWAKMDTGTNRGFESSADWTPGWNTWGLYEIRNWFPYEGTNMVRLMGWAGLWQNFEAIPGHKYTADAYLRNNSDDGLSNGTFGVVMIEWYDKNTNLISSVESPRLTAANNAWQLFTASSVAPSNVLFGRSIRKLDRATNAPIGSLYVDADTYAPAVVAKSHGAGKAVIVLHSLDCLPDGNGDYNPDNLPYLWRYDVLGGILKDYCGVQPAIKAVGANAYLCLPEYRTTTNGALLIQVKNYLYDYFNSTGGAPQTFTIQSDLLVGKTIRAFEQGKIVEKNSDGVFTLTLAPDGHEMLYAFGNGTPQVVNDDSDGSMYRGANDRSGALASGPASFPLQSMWTNNFSDGGAPVADGDRLYVTYNYFSTLLSAVNPATGSALWTYTLPSGEAWNRYSLAVANGTVFGTTKNNYGAPTGAVYAIDAATGTFKWKRYLTSINATPVCVRDGVVYFGGAADPVYAVSAETGETIWQTSNTVGASHYAGVTLASNKLVIINGSTMYAFNATNGSQVWSTYIPRSGWAQSAPAVYSNRIYVAMNDGGDGVRVYDLSTGSNLFNYSGFNVMFQTTGPALANGRMFILGQQLSSTNCYMYAFNAASTSLLWQVPLPLAYGSSVMIANNVIYFNADKFYALSATNGAQLWSGDYLYGGYSSYDPFTKNGWAFFSVGSFIYAFSDGTAWPVASVDTNVPYVVQIADGPSIIHPVGYSNRLVSIKVKYDSAGVSGLKLRLSFMEVGDNGDGVTNEIYQALTTNAIGSGENLFWMWIPDYSTTDADYKSTIDGGKYQFLASLEVTATNRVAESTPFPTRLEWGIRPTSTITNTLTKGQVVSVPVEWEDLYEQLYWQNTPLSRNVSFPSRVAFVRSSKTEQFYPGQFTKVNAVCDWLQTLGYTNGNPPAILFDDVRVNGTFLDNFNDGNSTGWARLAGCGNWTVTASPASATVGTVGYWKCDEAAWTNGVRQVLDSSGRLNHGTPVNGPRTTNDARRTRAGSFTSTNYVVCTNTASLQVHSNLTLSFWIKGQNIGAGRINPIDKSYGGEFCLTIETNRSLNFFQGKAKVSGQYTSWAALPANSITNNSWMHIAITRDGKNRTLRSFVNGILRNTTTYANSTNTLPVKTTDPVLIARGYTGYGLNGVMDEIKIYSNCLTAAQVAEDYRNTGSAYGLRAWRIGNDDNLFGISTAAWTNAAASVDIRYLTKGYYFSDAELLFRYVDRNNHYKIGIRNYYGAWRIKYTVKAGGAVQQQGWLYDFPKTNMPLTNVWYNLKVEAYGSTNRVYFNNTLVGTFWATNFASGKVALGTRAEQLGIWEPQKGFFFIDDDELSYYGVGGAPLAVGQPLNLDWGYLQSFFPMLILPSTYVMSDTEVLNVQTWLTNGLHSLLATDGGVARKNELNADDVGRIEGLFGVSPIVTNLALVSRVVVGTNDHYATLDYKPGSNLTASGAAVIWPLVSGGKALGTITNAGGKPALIVNTITNNPGAPAKVFCFNFGIDTGSQLTGTMFKQLALRAFQWVQGQAYKVRLELKYQLDPLNPDGDLSLVVTNGWILTGNGTNTLYITIPTENIMTGTNLYWSMFVYPWDAADPWLAAGGSYSSGNDGPLATLAGCGLQLLGVPRYVYAGRDWDLWAAYNATQTTAMVYGFKEKGTLLSEDNFNDAALTGWTITPHANISWRETNNMLSAAVLGTNYGYAYITRTGLNVTGRNVTVEYRAYFNGAAEGGMTFGGRVCYVNPTVCGWADNVPNYVSNQVPSYQWVNVRVSIRDGAPYKRTDLYVDNKPVFVDEPIQVTNWTSTTVGFLSPYYAGTVNIDSFRVVDEQYSTALRDNVIGQVVPVTTNDMLWATVPDYDPAWWEYDGSAYGGVYEFFAYLREENTRGSQLASLYFTPRLMVEQAAFPTNLSIGQTVNVPVDWENLDIVPARMGIYLQDALTGSRYMESNFVVSAASGSGSYPITIPAGVPPGSNYAWVAYIYPTNAADPQGQRIGRDDTYRFAPSGAGVEPETTVRMNSTGGNYIAYADIGIPMGASALVWGSSLNDGNYTNGAPEGVKYWKTSVPYLYGGWGVFYQNYTINLSQFGYLKFWVKSRRPIKIEIEAPQNTKRAVDLYGANWNPALAGQWQEVSIPITRFGFAQPLTNVYGPFSATMLSPRSKSLSFPTPDVGYAVGSMYDGGRGVQVSSILKTSGSGGTNWTFLRPGTNFELTTFYDVDFVNTNTGWIAANSKGVLRTTDGGLTWTQQTNGFTNASICSVDFIDANTGWALDSALHGRVFKTVNGGATWTAQYACTNMYVYYSKIRFANANNGWAVGGMWYATGRVMRTVNGGTTWTEHDVGSNMLVDVFVINATNVVVSGEGATIRKSDNAGLTWTDIGIPTSYDAFYGTGWQNTQTGWVCGVNGVVYKTTDGGASWSGYWCGYYGNAADIVFPDANTMYMALDTPFNTPGILKSTDFNGWYPSWTRMDGDANQFSIDNVRWSLTP